jgi:hypothetical protein
MAVKLPIMMPGMDPAQFEQDGGRLLIVMIPLLQPRSLLKPRKQQLREPRKRQKKRKNNSTARAEKGPQPKLQVQLHRRRLKLARQSPISR